MDIKTNASDSATDSAYAAKAPAKPAASAAPGKTEKIKLFVCFIQTHIGGAMTSLVNFLNALDTDKYEADVMFYEKGPGREGIKPDINILPQGKIHASTP